MSSPGKQKRPIKACLLLLGPAPTPPYLFVLTLDFGMNREPGQVFAFCGQGSVALAPAPSLPEENLGPGLLGGWGGILFIERIKSLVPGC